MPVCIIISNIREPFETNTFLFDFKVNGIGNFIFFFLLFCYFAEFIIFPTIYLLLFCFLTLRLANFLEETKRFMKTFSVSYNSASYRSSIHEKLLKETKFLEDTFCLPMFVQICLLMTISFTGLALEVEITRKNTRHIIEGILYMYSSIIGIIIIIYVGSKVHQPLEEIKLLNRKLYEHAVVYKVNSQTPSEIRSVSILKVMYKRPVVYLTAWGIFRLDKHLLFSAFGTMLTYGFLLIQLK